MKNTLAPMERTITLKRPTQEVISAGTPLEATVYFFNRQMDRIDP